MAINGTADHVHLLLRLRQDRAVSDVMREIKASSSGWVHRELPELSGFAWQGGYGAFTVSTSQVEKVRGYIANQVEHHRTQDFKAEFVALLKAHGVEYDERYLWGEVSVSPFQGFWDGGRWTQGSVALPGLTHPGL